MVRVHTFRNQLVEVRKNGVFGYRVGRGWYWMATVEAYRAVQAKIENERHPNRRVSRLVEVAK